MYPDGIIIEEKYTGNTTARPAWARLFKIAAAGDTIAFDAVSRMSRNAEEGITAYEDLYQRGVKLVFRQQPHMNSEKYESLLSEVFPRRGDETDYILEGVEKFLKVSRRKDFFLAFDAAEKENSEKRKNTKAGMAASKATKGTEFGRKKGQKVETSKARAAKREILKLSRDFDGHNTDEEVRAIVGISRPTYYKYKAELRAEREAQAAAEEAAILDGQD